MEMMTEYRIVGRFRKDTKFHVVGGGVGDRILDRSIAEIRMQKIMDDAEREMTSKKRGVTQAGSIGVSTEYYSEYDLLDIKLQSRQVTKWADEK